MDQFKEYTLAEYLLDKNTNFRTQLPLVHATKSSKLLSILSNKEISTTKCDTFTNEDLAYFFLGRPAYRKVIESPKEWELPTVLIFESACLLNKKRVYPFDSGAFLGGRLPSFITDFDESGYQVSQNASGADLIVEMFFGDDNRYYHGRSLGEEIIDKNNDLGINHSQIRALCSLYAEKSDKFDDRVLAIEFQTDQNVRLDDKLLGAVLPLPYKQNAAIKAFFDDINVLIESYDPYPINSEGYVAQVYNSVKNIYKKLGVIDE